MVPPDAVSISFAHAWVAGTSGCAGGSQRDTFRLTVLSCATAGVTLAASSNANNAFLISIISLPDTAIAGSLPALLYDIIILAKLTRRRVIGWRHVEAYNTLGSKYCGRKKQSLVRGRRGFVA